LTVEVKQSFYRKLMIMLIFRENLRRNPPNIISIRTASFVVTMIVDFLI